ncbi:hypothetical protein GE21DRAFT_1309652 [Neurospora crassa]|nr:hypothetical protein GE21DRAFT_1309652 [Neurospora crassa]
MYLPCKSAHPGAQAPKPGPSGSPAKCRRPPAFGFVTRACPGHTLLSVFPLLRRLRTIKANHMHANRRLLLHGTFFAAQNPSIFLPQLFHDDGPSTAWARPIVSLQEDGGSPFREHKPFSVPMPMSVL